MEEESEIPVSRYNDDRHANVWEEKVTFQVEAFKLWLSLRKKKSRVKFKFLLSLSWVQGMVLDVVKIKVSNFIK